MRLGADPMDDKARIGRKSCLAASWRLIQPSQTGQWSGKAEMYPGNTAVGCSDAAK
jgi:hypothetical protein